MYTMRNIIKLYVDFYIKFNISILIMNQYTDALNLIC